MNSNGTSLHGKMLQLILVLFFKKKKKLFQHKSIFIITTYVFNINIYTKVISSQSHQHVPPYNECLSTCLNCIRHEGECQSKVKGKVMGIRLTECVSVKFCKIQNQFLIFHFLFQNLYIFIKVQTNYIQIKIISTNQNQNKVELVFILRLSPVSMTIFSIPLLRRNGISFTPELINFILRLFQN